VKLLPAALQKQDYSLAAYVLVYGLVKASVKKPKNSLDLRRPRNSYHRDSQHSWRPRKCYGSRRKKLEKASHVEGIDEEIALLRVKLRELVEEQPERTDLHFEAANIIARLVKTRYQITKEQKKSLKEAIHKVLTEVAVPLGVGIGIKAVSK
jgi:hypothetical protein